MVEIADGEGGEEDVIQRLRAGLQGGGGAGAQEVRRVHVDEIQTCQLAQDHNHCPEECVTPAPGSQ